MRVLLGWLEAAATRRPVEVIAALAAVTVAAGALAASTLEVEVDLTQFGREDSEAVQAMDRVREDFSDPTAVVQVILDAGAGGDMLTADGLDALVAAEDVAVDALGPDVRTGSRGPEVLSLASPVGEALAAQDLDPAAADDARIGALAGRLVGTNPQLAALVSDDLDPDEGTARAAVVVALLDPGLTEAERADAAGRVQAAFDGGHEGALGDVRVTVFSNGLFVSGLLDAIRSEVPLLFALALLVVLTILAVMYRSVFDVGVGLVGLLATVVCMLGSAALLGPALLGWTGPLSQLVVIIPVLLVGLGIDYSVHLTARYREQRIAGQGPPAAAGRAVHTVGAALVLATVGTAIGFASIALAPLQMLADFGVFVAVGVVWAFVIMGLLVPAAAVWRDRRAARRAGADQEPAAVREIVLGPLMRVPASLARRHPVVGVGVAAALVGGSLLAATGLEVEFDRDDFIPEGSGIEATLAHQTELFGGGVTESTFVVIDGDLTDPTLANAVLDGQREAGGIDGVRTVGGTPQIISVVALAARLLDPEVGPPPGADVPATGAGPSGSAGPVDPWTGDGFAVDADLAAVYHLLRRAVGAHRVERLLAPDAGAAVVQIRTTAGDAGAERIAREVAAAFAPVERAGATVAVTSEPIIIGEMSEELSAFQIQAIALTLAIVLVLLAAYYGVAYRRPLLGAIAMIPAVVSASLVLGAMWLLGISFNVLTATLTAIAVGIGVPYGIHVVNRFVEDREAAPAAEAVARTLRSTGGALAGSALTTLGAFVVLSFSGLPPIRSLGLLGGIAIAIALLVGLLVEPGALVLWARRHDRTAAPDRAGSSTTGGAAGG